MINSSTDDAIGGDDPSSLHLMNSHIAPAKEAHRKTLTATARIQGHGDEFGRPSPFLVLRSRRYDGPDRRDSLGNIGIRSPTCVLWPNQGYVDHIKIRLLRYTY